MISSEIMYLQILNGRQLFKFEKPTTHFWKNYRKLLGTLKTTSCKQSAIRQTRIFHFNLLLIFFKSSICNCHNDEDSFFLTGEDGDGTDWKKHFQIRRHWNWLHKMKEKMGGNCICTWVIEIHMEIHIYVGSIYVNKF